MSNTLQAKSAQLVAAFEKRLDHDKSELLTSAEFASQGYEDSGFEIVRYIAHRIVGSARLFGCQDLTEPAKRVELLIEEGADIGAIMQAVNALVDIIDRTLADGIPHPDWIKSDLP
ncbi:Hpt domain-containing protein [Roseibium aggregatum]|uniref:Hpt domain-containing protein n=1 Tax=Roseibium aggregatum TaxID=187304 RepID=A0A939EBX6_9HYPH|nr:Hpt domain-containing protein [Roseibium aggregatum]MBN9669772.1 Hpt domain-containing protein [Roseibium aggregatum]